MTANRLKRFRTTLARVFQGSGKQCSQSRVFQPAHGRVERIQRHVLKEAHRNYGHYGFGELRKIVDRLPEYVDPQGSSLRIDPAAILKEEGWSEEEIEDARMSAREEIFLGTLEEHDSKIRA